MGFHRDAFATCRVSILGLIMYVFIQQNCNLHKPRDLAHKTQWDMNLPYLSSSTLISGRSISYLVPRQILSWKGLIIGVLSSIENTRARAIVRRTWGYDVEVLFILAGHPSQVMVEFKAHEDILLLLNENERYNGSYSILPYKTQTFFHAINTHIENFSYILKTDDDSFVDVHRLWYQLIREQPDYWGYVWKDARVIRDPQSRWYVSYDDYPQEVYPNYCSGAGYVLSRSFIACATLHLSNFSFMPREDVGTGILASKCAVAPRHSNSVSHAKPLKKNVTIQHYVKSFQDMFKLWQASSMFNS